MPHASLPALHTLLEQAERERDAARAALRQAEDGERQAREQAAQLARYRQDCLGRWGAQTGRAGTVAQLHCYHGFMQRLDQATGQQQRQCDSSAQRVAQAREQLNAREMRAAAVRKLIERRLQAVQAQTDRRAQKQTDEAAQRSAWAQRAAAPAAGNP